MEVVCKTKDHGRLVSLMYQNLRKLLLLGIVFGLILLRYGGRMLDGFLVFGKVSLVVMIYKCHDFWEASGKCPCSCGASRKCY